MLAQWPSVTPLSLRTGPVSPPMLAMPELTDSWGTIFLTGKQDGKNSNTYTDKLCSSLAVLAGNFKKKAFIWISIRRKFETMYLLVEVF